MPNPESRPSATFSPDALIELKLTGAALREREVAAAVKKGRPGVDDVIRAMARKREGAGLSFLTGELNYLQRNYGEYETSSALYEIYKNSKDSKELAFTIKLILIGNEDFAGHIKCKLEEIGSHFCLNSELGRLLPALRSFQEPFRAQLLNQLFQSFTSADLETHSRQEEVKKLTFGLLRVYGGEYLAKTLAERCQNQRTHLPAYAVGTNFEESFRQNQLEALQFSLMYATKGVKDYQQKLSYIKNVFTSALEPIKPEIDPNEPYYGLIVTRDNPVIYYASKFITKLDHAEAFRFFQAVAEDRSFSAWRRNHAVDYAMTANKEKAWQIVKNLLDDENVEVASHAFNVMASTREYLELAVPCFTVKMDYKPHLLNDLARHGCQGRAILREILSDEEGEKAAIYLSNNAAEFCRNIGFEELLTWMIHRGELGRNARAIFDAACKTTSEGEIAVELEKWAAATESNRKLFDKLFAA